MTSSPTSVFFRRGNEIAKGPLQTARQIEACVLCRWSPLARSLAALFSLSLSLPPSHTAQEAIFISSPVKGNCASPLTADKLSQMQVSHNESSTTY